MQISKLETKQSNYHGHLDPDHVEKRLLGEDVVVAGLRPFESPCPLSSRSLFRIPVHSSDSEISKSELEEWG